MTQNPRLRVVVFAVLALLLACGVTTIFYTLVAPASFTLLIAGLDARPGEGVQARTDAVLLVNVRPRRAEVAVLSIPRDVFLRAPNYGLQRVNTINLLGELESAGRGMPLLKEAIEASLELRIDRTLRLDFQGFVALIDALGGVEVDVPRLLVDRAFPTIDYGTKVVSFEPGPQTLSGEQALIYARMRNVDDDYGRAARQQQVVRGLAARLANPLNWGTAWSVFQASVESDLTLGEALILAPAILLNAGRHESLVMDRSFIRPGARGAEPDLEALKPFLDQHFRE
ncbi:MAG: LCP family protein [Anaerolineae bacterium]|nr:LCP family protein [Anaerolineae bacterium]MDW8172008.1 LCP family protein [Anaerolineae bacterium]